MPPHTASAPLTGLNTYLSACRASFAKCIDVVTHSANINGLTATTRMHHIKFDGNGKLMIPSLAECLYNHVIDYCLATRNRSQPLSSVDAAKLTKEARKLFIHPPASPSDPDRTGEAGEMLLYFMIEAILNVPQVVAKMELKTNNAMEIHGSDGIHMTWNPVDSIVEVYFGEAKLYQSISAAMTNALKSVESFHASDMCRHEFKMVTKHFKYADPAVQQAVGELLGEGVPSSGVRINHACLIGYDWAEYASLPNAAPAALTSEFKTRYTADAPRLHNLLQERFDTFAHKQIRFEVFFMPFKSVQDFRDAFNAALD